MGVAPILSSRAFAETAAFWRRLGFEPRARHPDYLILASGEDLVHFWLEPDLDPWRSNCGCYLYVENAADAFAGYDTAGLPSAGIPRWQEPEPKPWNMLEGHIVDPSGNLIRIGSRLSAG
ncbi:MAG TPA: VOC family protein [Afifellaceae bacterium]|nr:VOC family protein [Afifellaceae bacterium]